MPSIGNPDLEPKSSNMTRYYLYIKAGLEIDLETRFYKVGIGTGTIGRRLQAWLEAYALEHGHFFVIWSHESCEFYEKCRSQVGPGAAPLIGIHAAALKKSLKNGCEDPAFWQAIQHRHQLMMQIDPHYYYYHQISK